jgi:hypothetical protein
MIINRLVAITVLFLSAIGPALAQQATPPYGSPIS